MELDPGAAFGTGQHATTSLCIRALEDLVRPGMTVFDVGTGSGVLAIVAAKLGAKRVEAVDFDPVAVRVARENVRQNGAEDVVRTERSDLLKSVEGRADHCEHHRRYHRAPFRRGGRISGGGRHDALVGHHRGSSGGCRGSRRPAWFFR